MTMPHDLVRFPEACEVVTAAGLDDTFLGTEIFGGRVPSYVVGGRLYVRHLHLDLWVRHARAAGAALLAAASRPAA
ncbi:MAG: hypothetical protein ACYCUG_07635 [Acidimicrobiales bacterium]